jgi:hypothetical protein
LVWSRPNSFARIKVIFQTLVNKINSREELAATGGLGVGYRGFTLEYAYQYNANADISLGQSHRFTFEVKLGEFLNKEETKPNLQEDQDQKAKLDAIKAKYRSNAQTEDD